MNAGMKMLMVDAARKRGSGRSGGRMGYSEGNYARMGYDSAEGTYGARNGMEMGYGKMGMEPESRRRRDSRGRFRSEMGEVDDDYGEMNNRNGYGRSEMEPREMRSGMRGFPNRPFPVYEGGNGMNQIGFNAGEEFPSEYRMEATHYTGNEMEYMQGAKMGGYSSGSSHTLTKEMAEEWTGSMKNEDGTKGPHWTMEQVKQVMAQKGIDTNPVEMWAVLNMMYSDYCSVFKKHGVNKMDLYIDLACAWLNDKDAQKGKTARYFEEIVKH